MKGDVVKELLGADVYNAARIIGYGLFTIIGVFILAAGLRAILDVRQALKGQRR